MNLTELQLELRKIEEQVATLHNEVEKMKPQTEEDKKIDYEKITKLAEKNPIVNSKIKSISNENKKLIFSSYAYILLLEERDLYIRILYLCRLAKGSEYDVTAEELYILGLRFGEMDLNELISNIATYKYTYLVELLIMANLSAESSVSILKMIADISRMFKVNKEEMRVLGIVAKSVLINDENYIFSMNTLRKSDCGSVLRECLSDELVKKYRKECGKLCLKKYVYNIGNDFQDLLNFTSLLEASDLAKYTYLVDECNSTSQKGVKYIEKKPCEIISRLQTGNVVKKGDVICTYSEREINNREKIKKGDIVSLRSLLEQLRKEQDYVIQKIIAPCDGVVFFIEDKKRGTIKDKSDEYIAIYVVPYFDDYTDFCDWYRRIEK